MISNASGQTSPLDPHAPGALFAQLEAVWSADGQYVIYTRPIEGQRLEIARIRPGSTAAPEILATYPMADGAQQRRPVSVSPTGEWILAKAGTTRPPHFLMTPDFKTERALTSARLGDVPGFSKDGRELISVVRNVSGDGAPWQLWAVDIATGRERKLADVDLPVATEGVGGFSLHPDGTRFLASAGASNTDIWMLKGFDRR
jgi:Tol biopolymer transport system component